MQITIILLLPSLIVLSFCIFDSFYHITHYRDLIISNYSNELNSLLKDTDEKVDFTINNMLFLANVKEINSALTANTELSYEEFNSLSYQLNQATYMLDIIDSIIIYNKRLDFVITSHGMQHPDEYFSSFSKYGHYDYSYWYNYDTNHNGIKILQASKVTNEASPLNRTIVPIVLTSADNPSQGMLIVNIDLKKVFEEFETYRLTANSHIYMIDNSSGNVYSDSFFDNAENLEYTLLKHLNTSLYSNADMVLLNGKKHIFITSTKRSNSWGYSYIVDVPYSDVKSNLANIFLVSFISVSLIFIIILLYVLFASKHLYSPWKNMLRSLNIVNSETISDIPDYIANAITTLSLENKNLEKKSESILSLNQEKYLISILNEGISATDENLKELDFKYEYFMAISAHIVTNASFFTDENYSQQSTIHKRLQQAIKSFFSQDFITYELPCTQNIMYLLLNLKEESQYNDVLNTIKSIQDMLSYDKDKLLVIFSYGNIYKGYRGLKLTHKESISNMINILNTSEIQFATVNQSFFSPENESVLNNYFKLRLIDSIKDYISNIFRNTANAPSSKKRQVYIDISNYLRNKLIQMNIQSAIPYIDFIIDAVTNNSDISDESVYTSIYNVLTKIEDHINSKKLKIEDVINYIDDHYTENIFLDDLARIFNISSKHLSKKIKDFLGVPFKEYVTAKKIDKAKDLLEHTDITINELYSKVGFQDRISFTRAFKQKTGIAPSEFKKRVRDVQGNA